MEYTQDAPSITDRYFEKMGMKVRYFMPANSAAPLAFYFIGDLLADYANLEMIAAISVMETFRRSIALRFITPMPQLLHAFNLACSIPTIH